MSLLKERGEGGSKMQLVYTVLSEEWNVPVLCDCMTKEHRVCRGTCMTTSVTAMGFTTHLHDSHPALIYV